MVSRIQTVSGSAFRMCRACGLKGLRTIGSEDDLTHLSSCLTCLGVRLVQHARAVKRMVISIARATIGSQSHAKVLVLILVTTHEPASIRMS